MLNFLPPPLTATGLAQSLRSLSRNSRKPAASPTVQGRTNQWIRTEVSGPALMTVYHTVLCVHQGLFCFTYENFNRWDWTSSLSTFHSGILQLQRSWRFTRHKGDESLHRVDLSISAFNSYWLAQWRKLLSLLQLHFVLGIKATVTGSFKWEMKKCLWAPRGF